MSDMGAGSWASTTAQSRPVLIAATLLVTALTGLAWISLPGHARAGRNPPQTECASDLWSGGFWKLEIEDGKAQGIETNVGNGAVSYLIINGTFSWMNRHEDTVFRWVMKLGNEPSRVSNGSWPTGDGDSAEMLRNLSHITLCFTADVSSSSSSSSSTTSTTTPPPPDAIVTVIATDSNGSEAGSDPIVFDVSRDQSAGTLAVNAALGGTAGAGDYTVSASGGSHTGGVVTFNDGAATVTIILAPVDDSENESDETVTLTLAAGSGYVVGSPSEASGTITDDDPPPPLDPTLSIADVTQAEGNAINTLTLTVTRSHTLTEPVSVSWATSDGSATAGTDYTASSGTITFATGQATATIVITVLGDTDVESNETFTLNLFSPSGATISDGSATVSLTNDDITVPPQAGTVFAVLTDNEATCDGSLKYTAYFINLGNKPAHITATLELPEELQTNSELQVGLTVAPDDFESWTWTVDIGTNAAQTVIAGLEVEAPGFELHAERWEPTVLTSCEPPGR